VKVTLCYPALLPGHKPKYGLQPLGVLYIGALLREHGIDVEVLDADVDGLTSRRWSIASWRDSRTWSASA
jgi:hypothetical protein